MTSKWQVDGNQARLTHGPLNAELDLSRPSAGLHGLQLANRPIDGAILGVALSPASSADSNTPVESYIRGDDLVATYPQTDVCPFRLQVYWRITHWESRPNDAAVEQIVSVQTSLLDAHPVVSTMTTLAADAVSRVGEDATFQPVAVPGEIGVSERPPCFSFQRDESSMNYAAMCLPVDFSGATVHREESGNVTLRLTLVTQWLEKGVILRAKQLGVFFPQDDAANATAYWYHWLHESRLPLTT